MEIQANKEPPHLNHFLIDHVEAIIFLVNVDQNGTLTYEKINQAHERASGLSSDAIKGKTPSEVVGGEMGKSIEANYRRCLKAGNLVSYEETLILPAGKRTWLTKLSPIFENSHVVQIVGVSTDITERKRNEEIQKKLYQRIDAGLKAGNLSWWEMELPSGNVWFDERKAEMLGYSPDKFDNFEDFMALVHPDDYEPTMQAMRAHINGETELYEVVYRIQNKAGQYQWFKDVGSITEKEAENGTLKVIGVVEDITKQKQAEESLIESKNRLKLTLQSIGDAVISTDTKGNVVRMNPVAEDLTGWDAESAKGKPVKEIFKIISSITGEELAPPVKKVLETGQTLGLSNHTSLISKDSRQFQIADSAAPIRDDEGNIHGVIMVFRDVTEQYKQREVLQQSEARQKAILKGTNAGTWEWNVKTGETIFNERWAGIIGYSLQELAPVTIETWMNHTHPDDLKHCQENLERHFRGETDYYECECRMQHKDGHWVWVLDHGAVLEWAEDGKPLWMFGTHTDITNLKNTQQQLEEQTKTLRERNKEISCIFKMSEIVQKKEQPLIEMLQEFAEIIPPAFRFPSSTCAQITFDGQSFNSKGFNETPLKISSDIVFHGAKSGLLEVFLQKQSNNSNTPSFLETEKRLIHILAERIGRIAERKDSENKFRKSEEKFRKLFEKHTAVQIIIDAETTYLLDANKAASEFYGWSNEKLKQMKISNINTLSVQEVRREMDKALSQERTYFEFKHRLANGEIRDVEVFSNKIKIEGKEVLHSIIHDITEKKKNEQALIESKRLAEAANIAKSEFLSTMSHELRTPLNGVIGFSEILKFSGLTDEQNGYVDTVLSSANNLLAIISDILHYSSIDAKHFELHPEKTDLGLLIQKTCSMIQHKAVKKGLTCAVDMGEDIPQTVHVDSGKLRQILLNLLSNAVKFTEKGRVGIKLTVVDKDDDNVRIRFQVTDTGIGIKEKDQEIIFKAFQQADMSITRQYEGTGLGLTISSDLVQKMGSTFSFELLLPYENEKEQASGKNDVEGLIKPLSVKGKTVLIAEDNQINMRYADKALSMFSKDIRIVKAKDGKEAYKLFLEHKPDLVLMDLIMPEVDGYQATAMIRNRDEQTPIVAMTAKAYSED